MARIPREIVEAVRERADLVEVVGRHVALRKAGRSYIGLCPFHQEKTPSFHVVPDKHFYHCFGCQASGDVFRFLQEIEGLGFAEAVRELAGQVGVEISTEALTANERDQLRRKATLRDTLEEAARLYAGLLLTGSEGAPAREYLLQRGLTTKTLEAWQIGWAPEGWQTLLDHLRHQRISADLAIEAGLARQREHGGGAYDAFRARVILPIRDERGRVIAMGGRLLEGDGPKYINSPETALYQKSSVLFGIDAARRAIERKGRAILVEGYFDVISLHQAGFDEAVATCGTSLTREHAERLRRLCRRVYVVTDADEAGMRAAERALPILEGAQVASFRLQILDAKDPDELVREQGAEAFESLLDRAQPLLTWVAARKLAEHGYSAAGKQAARDGIADLLRGLSTTQASEIAPILRIPEGELVAWARAHGRRQAPGPRAEAPEPASGPPSGWRPSREDVHLLWLAIHHPDATHPLLQQMPPELVAAAARPVLARLLDGEAPASILDDASDPGVRNALSRIIARDQLYTLPQAAPAVAEICARVCLTLSERALAQSQEQAVAAIRQGDQDGWGRHSGRIEALRRERRAVESTIGQLARARRETQEEEGPSQEVLDAAHAALHAVCALADRCEHARESVV